MFPPFLPSSSKRSDGFTLMELLVVIGIIAILAGILMPVTSKIQNMSRKVQAVNDMKNIKVAILSYYSDYRKYPINDLQAGAGVNAYDNGGDDTVYGDPGGKYTSADLFDILRAQEDALYNANNALNPNKVVYWTGQLAKNITHPVDGITMQDVKDGDNTIKAGSFVDPWGNPYVVWLDVNNDGDLSTAAKWFYKDIVAGSVHPGLAPAGIEFASLGPDGEWGTHEDGILKGSDDIVTW